MHYAVNKETNLVKYSADNLYLLQHVFDLYKDDIHNYKILEESGMRIVSRIVYVDDECIYNSKSFWLSDKPAQILENYSKHEVIDFLGKPVDELRFKIEKDNNQSRLAAIEDRAGEVCYNIEVGNEMIALFKEECILTDFQGITPLELAAKLGNIFPLILTGSFREAKTLFLALETDPFITEERKQKYIDMLDAADSIEYADSSEYLFTAEEEKKIEDTLERFTRVYTTSQSVAANGMQKEHTFYYAALHDKDNDIRLQATDKLIFVIRHAERDDSNTSDTGDINSTGVSRATSIGTKLRDGATPSSSESTNTVDIPTNDAHYFSTNITRTMHTAQAIAAARGDTDSSASDYSGITIKQELLDGYRFLKQKPSSSTTALLKKYCYHQDELTQEELETNIGVSTVEEAHAKLLSDTEKFVNEIIAEADKRLNIFVTHDYFIGPLVTGITNYGLSTESNSPWVNWCSGIAIIVHEDKTYDTFAVKCS